MEPEFWQQRWREGRIGFHLTEVNPWLRKYLHRLELPEGGNVLVPLCGKSLDLLWLAGQGYRVTGIEVSRLAVEAFYTENQLEYQLLELPGGRLYRGGGVDIYCGDFFQLDLRQGPPIDAIYDRAALVAMPAAMRPAYARRLLELLPAGRRALLVTLDYPQEQMGGPPFAVSDAEVEQLFAAVCAVTRLVSDDCLQREPRFREKGLERLDEKVFLLSRRE